LPKPLVHNSLGTPFIELLSIDSTNNYALTQAHAGLALHGMTFFAHEQIAGKGQRGKKWTAPKDSSLIVSVVVDPEPLQVNQQFQFSACVAVSAHELFSKYAGSDTRIKWPNDLYWRDRKAGGILIENIIGRRKGNRDDQRAPGHTEKNEPQSGWIWSVAGIGININQTGFPAEIRNPVSLKQITGQSFNTVELAKELCLLMDKNFKKLLSNGFDEIYARYLSQLYKKNELVKLKKGNRVFEAVIRSISPTGELVVQHTMEESFCFGDVEWIITPG
jgi:BirA family biotin operon repressor/biotin-[acetyl-CoA-carboxylase] ligase